MAGESLHDNNPALQKMLESFGNSLNVATVSELGEREILFVEDGNHGESQEEFEATGIAFLRPPDLKDGRVDFHNCGRINEAGFRRVRKGIGKRGDIILTHRATVGRIAITGDDAPEVFVTNPGTTIWRSTSNEALNQRYLYCFMRSAAFMNQLWSQVGNNSTFDYVSLTQQRGLLVAFPPIPEQHAIAHVLGTLDDKIELNRRMNETLEAMAQALFKSWFVDFDPVRAKAEGRDPGLPQPLADLFPTRLINSELGEIPEGWEMESLPKLVEVNPTRALRKDDIAPYLDMRNMPTSGHTPDSVVDRPFGSGMRFMNGDTLVARITPCLENGKAAYVDFLEADQVGWGSTEYIVLRPKPPLPSEFAYCLARGPEFRDFAVQSMTGSSGRQRVPVDSLSHFRLVVAPSPIPELFGKMIKPLFARAAEGASESRTLAAQRDTLLPKLISGDLRVKEAKRFIERAT